MAPPLSNTAGNFARQASVVNTTAPTASPRDKPCSSVASYGRQGPGLTDLNERNPSATNVEIRSPPTTMAWRHTPSRIMRLATMSAETPEMQAFEITTGCRTALKYPATRSAKQYRKDSSGGVISCSSRSTLPFVVANTKRQSSAAGSICEPAAISCTQRIIRLSRGV